MLLKKFISIICIISVFTISLGLNKSIAITLDENTNTNFVEQTEKIEEEKEDTKKTDENEILDEEDSTQDVIEPTIDDDTLNNDEEIEILPESEEREETIENKIQEEPKELEMPVLINTENLTDIETPTRTIKDGTYIIYSALGNNACLDVTGGSTANAANIQIWKEDNVDQQKFKVKYIGDGYYTITSFNSNKLLDVAWEGRTNGTNVHQYESNGSNPQKWIIKDLGDGYYNIISKHNNLYLDVNCASNKNGTNVQVYEKNGTDAQKFRFKYIEELSGEQTIENGIYFIKPDLSGSKVLEVSGGSSQDAANIQIWSKVNHNKQKFLITYKGNGFYEIENIYSGKVLDVAYGLSKNGTNVDQYERNNTNAQKWIIKDLGDGYYNIISRCGALYLDIAYGLNTNGTNVQIYEKNGTNAQKFKLEKTDINIESKLKTGVYIISSGLNENKVLDIEDAKTESGANLQIWENSKTKQQKFMVTYLNNGFYRITSIKSSKALDVANGSNLNGTNVWQYTTNNTRAQDWIIKDIGDGYYNIISRCGGLYLDIAGGNPSNGTNVQIYEGNGTNAQKFKFIKSETDGIDVSKFNGKIDWKKVSATGIDFAFIRVAYRGYGTGKFADDEKFEENIKGCIENNIDCGVYFVTQAINYEEGEEEALYVLNKIKDYKINCPIVIDVEDSAGDPGRADDLTVEERTNAIKGFCDTIEKNGYSSMIYTSKSWIKDKIDLTKIPNAYLWLAHYVSGAPEKLTDYTGDYLYWQYTSQGHLDGISGYVDLNKGY